METTDRMHRDIDAFVASIRTCPYDRRSNVLGRLARQFCEGLAALSEDMTGECGDRVAECAEFLIEEINAMVEAADDKAEERRAEQAA